MDVLTLSFILGLPLPLPFASSPLASQSSIHAVPDADGTLPIQLAVQQTDFALYNLLADQYPPGDISKILDNE